MAGLQLHGIIIVVVAAVIASIIPVASPAAAPAVATSSLWQQRKQCNFQHQPCGNNVNSATCNTILVLELKYSARLTYAQVNFNFAPFALELRWGYLLNARTHRRPNTHRP